jgi:hypothetical protein
MEEVSKRTILGDREQGGEMAQTMYAHMNKEKKRGHFRETEQFGFHWNH